MCFNGYKICHNSTKEISLLNKDLQKSNCDFLQVLFFKVLTLQTKDFDNGAKFGYLKTYKDFMKILSNGHMKNISLYIGTRTNEEDRTFEHIEITVLRL